VSLREAAKAVEARKAGPKCSVQNYRSTLDPEDLKYLDTLLASDNASTYISDVIRADGGLVSDFSIRRHRNGRCLCP